MLTGRRNLKMMIEKAKHCWSRQLDVLHCRHLNLNRANYDFEPSAAASRSVFFKVNAATVREYILSWLTHEHCCCSSWFVVWDEILTLKWCTGRDHQVGARAYVLLSNHIISPMWCRLACKDAQEEGWGPGKGLKTWKRAQKRRCQRRRGANISWWVVMTQTTQVSCHGHDSEHSPTNLFTRRLNIPVTIWSTSVSPKLFRNGSSK